MTAATNGVTQFGVTKFSDLTSDEFRSQYLNYKPSQRVFPTTEVNVEGLGVAADQVLSAIWMIWVREFSEGTLM